MECFEENDDLRLVVKLCHLNHSLPVTVADLERWDRGGTFQQFA